MASSPLHPDRHQLFAADEDMTSLAAAQIAVEHMAHHGRQLKWSGSSYVGPDSEHRFACHDPSCCFTANVQVHES